MNSQLTIHAEISPGATIEDAAKEACELASRLNVCIEFDFQDQPCIAMPGGDPRELVGYFYLIGAGKSNNRNAIAHSNR